MIHNITETGRTQLSMCCRQSSKTCPVEILNWHNERGGESFNSCDVFPGDWNGTVAILFALACWGSGLYQLALSKSLIRIKKHRWRYKSRSSPLGKDVARFDFTNLIAFLRTSLLSVSRIREYETYIIFHCKTCHDGFFIR